MTALWERHIQGDPRFEPSQPFCRELHDVLAWNRLEASLRSEVRTTMNKVQVNQ